MNTSIVTGICTIYLIRHGHTEWNEQGLLQGQGDSPLTKRGIAEIYTRAEEFKTISFNAVYSSDLGRAKTTAELITKHHQLAVVTNELLREKHFGRLEGRKWSKVKEELRDELKRRETLVENERKQHKFFPEMETDEEGVARLITFLRQVALVHLSHKILVVSHGGVMRALLVHLGYATHQQLPSETIANTGYVVLESDGIDFFIKKTVGITKTLVSST
jgi:broad specificity phosphatase PhoE